MKNLSSFGEPLAPLPFPLQPPAESAVSGAASKAIGQLQDKGVLGKEQVEPATTVAKLQAKTGPLPADFPYFSVLNAAGIHTYFQLAKYANDYTQIYGVGPEAITEALKQ